MRTREQLIARVLKNLGVLAAGEDPANEDRAEVDDLIEPTCAKLFDDGVAKLTGDEIADAAYLPLAAIVAEAALVPFGIGGTKAAELRGLAEQARMDLRLAYRVYDARPPVRIEAFWGSPTRARRPLCGGFPQPTSPTIEGPITVTVNGGREG